MSGIRIRHHTRRNQMLPVPLVHQPRINKRDYPPCGTCGVVHPCKVMHLELDGEGAVIVSVPGWENLQHVPNWGGFRVVGEVAKPPTRNLMLPTKKVALDGVDVAGVLALEENKTQFFVGSGGRNTTNPEQQVDLRTVSVEDYFDIMERRGYTPEEASRKLLTAVWKDGTATKGAQ